MKTPVRKLKCAIYTRKSSEEGLDMEFNSLDAQREACAAFIASQKAEGWCPVPDRYDDGGWSGGSLERPALKRLLADVEAGRIDIIVVYKVDRLSRSLLDFAKLVEAFERRNVSFVSVTQSFNTTSSMGRLTLNILLSFAQFEREVIGERIRDKFAASRRKGMWMGGVPPLGYDVVNRKLVVNRPEADLVRLVFRRFLELGSATDLVQELQAAGYQTKSWTTQDGKARQGKPIDKGALYKLLGNRVYLGEAVHKGVSFPGEHEAIIDQRTWDRVHAALTAKTPTRQLFDSRAIQTQTPGARRLGHRTSSPRAATPALLKGLLFDGNGVAFSPTHTRKNGRLYRTYVSQTAIKNGADVGGLRSIAAGEIEGAVIGTLRATLRTPELVVRTWKQAAADGDRFSERAVTTALQRLDPLWEELFPAEQARILRLLVARATVGPEGVRVDLRAEGIATLVSDLSPPPTSKEAAP